MSLQHLGLCLVSTEIHRVTSRKTSVLCVVPSRIYRSVMGIVGSLASRSNMALHEVTLGFGIRKVLRLATCLFVVSDLAYFTESQQCGVPKSTDSMALSQQFKTRSRRKRDMPGHSPDRSADVHRRNQTVLLPWELDLNRFQNNDRIVGGYDVHDPSGGQICWQVGIIIGTANGYFNCGGSILGSRTILTACHCVYNRRSNLRKPSEFTVVVGALDGNFDGSNAREGATNCGKSFKVSNVIPHPSYKPNDDSGNNDLALLTLSSDIDLTSSCACAVCLLNKSPPVGEWTAVSGYGDVSEGGLDDPNPVPLRWVYLQVLTNTNAKCSFQTKTDPNLFICAGDVVGQDSCQGDSGGPLFAWDSTKLRAYYLAGIVSFGQGCARGLGGQYTKVQAYLQWISQNAGQDLSIRF